MSKNKKKHPVPNVPAETLLRIRLDGLWQNPDLPNQTNEHIERDLKTVTHGSKSEPSIRVMLHAFQDAPPLARERLAHVLPAWLAQQDHLDALEALIHSGKLTTEIKPVAYQWLTALGRNVRTPVENQVSTFQSAYSVHEEWQSAVMIIWFSNKQRTRARGMEFLLDRNPPWQGAVKDIMLLENKTPLQLKERYVDIWVRRGQPMTPLSAMEAKRLIVTAFRDNLSARIRLPRELVNFREHVFEHILTLPDSPEMLPFTIDDFHLASQSGQPAEAVARFEQKAGRRIIDDDGQEVFIDAKLANTLMKWDRETWDDEDDA